MKIKYIIVVLNLLVSIGTFAQPVIDNIATNNPQCIGVDDGSITVSATGNGTMQYSIDNGSTFQSSNLFTGLTPGTYDIVVTDITGNSSSQITLAYEQTVTAAFTPSVTAGAAVLIVDFTNNSTGASTYNWNLDGGTAYSTMVNPTYSYDMPGTYTVTLIASDNACYDTATAVITVTGNSAILTTPNVFSPNNDGINDIFIIPSVGIETMEVFIFNRYGEIVYEWFGKNGYWDGHTYPAGQAVPDGTYYFYYKATGFDSQNFEDKGVLTISR